MTRWVLPAGGDRFAMKVLNYPMWFRRFPIAVPAPEGLVGFINNASRQAAGIYRDGAWRDGNGRPLTWEPTHWTAMDDEEEPAR